MKKITLIIAALILLACGNDAPVRQEIKITGYAQGTTYSVVYISEDGKNYQRAIDSTLIEIDNVFSTYQKNSLVSKYNELVGETRAFPVGEMFVKVFNVSNEVFTATNGNFDPTVAPLVNAWGFGFENKNTIDSLSIDSLLKLVGFDEKILISGHLHKITNQTLDFNAVAQGYTVDVLGNELEKRGVKNYLVEVGGELKAKGLNINDTLWRVGIDKPLPDLKQRELEAIVHLDNKSLATSGNYRKFYEKDGKKYSHTINPQTGYPVEHNLLSATVIANECAYADAYATAFMVMGLEKSKEFLNEHKELKALLIYSDENGDLQTFITDNLTEYIELNANKN